MVEPRPLPPLPQPFAVEPRRLRGREGCGRGALIGCGALVLLLGVAAVGLTLRAGEAMVWLLEKMEARVAAHLPSDVTATERQRFERAFDQLYRSIELERFDQRALQELQQQLMAVAGDLERGLSREQLRELTLAVERAAAAPPGAAAGPTPAPAPN
jgi:hypothetical protein